ncbi:MAG: TauD/TfdA family dioxygenase [Ilumatobacteraceae bacterium]|nr:TauD/TfdA family dioxygenase [Ilumatobacteraceae bacterium]
MNTDQWMVSPLTGTFGAELTGGRLADGIDGGWLHDLLTTHLVLVLRGQHPTRPQQVALARSLGEPTPAHPVVPGHPDHPEILVVDGALGGRNARWHTDLTFMPTPPAASVLVSDAVPPYGGDTMWADTRSAYERLAPALQSAVEQLEAVHRISPLAYWGEPFDTALTRADVQQLFDDASKVPPVIHPVVRVHPLTGRKNLFVNPGFTTHIVGMSRIESDGLLQLLYAHATQPEFVMRHHWAVGDIVIWDNRATMHYAVDDYGVVERRMRRVTIRGDKPVGPTGAESRIADDPLIAVR